MNLRFFSSKRPLRSFSALLLCAVPWAPARAGIGEAINSGMEPVANVADKIVFLSIAGVPAVLLLLAGTAVFLTVYFRFINIRCFGLALRTAKGKYTPPDAPGEITHFQALSAALSATVGLGNIGGVAVAVGMGGPGATFWMIVLGLCGMTTKFAECTLGVKFRQIDPDGRVRGGAMYYLSDGLKARGFDKLGRVLAFLFALFVIGGAFGAGNMFQANQSYTQVAHALLPGVSGVVFGTGMAILVALVIIGGIVWIARVTSILVPFMCLGYAVAAVIIILANIEHLGPALASIFTGAFDAQAVSGGIVGVLIQGIKRATFSNEAGFGSAPIAHSAVKTDRPASEGFVALLEPFTDTVVVCTMTALVIIIAGSWQVSGEINLNDVALVREPESQEVIQPLQAGQFVHSREVRTAGKGAEARSWTEIIGLVSRDTFEATPVKGWVLTEQIDSKSGIPVTSMAFATVIGWFPVLLSVAVFLFAFSTMISWSYYGEQGVRYLVRTCGGGGNGEVAVLIYKFVFCCLVVVGTSSSLDNVLKLSDAMVFAMVVPNLIGIYALLPVIRQEADLFLEHVRSVEAGDKPPQ